LTNLRHSKVPQRSGTFLCIYPSNFKIEVSGQISDVHILCAKLRFGTVLKDHKQPTSILMKKTIALNILIILAYYVVVITLL